MANVRTMRVGLEDMRVNENAYHSGGVHAAFCILSDESRSCELCEICLLSIFRRYPYFLSLPALNSQLDHPLL